MRKKPTVSPELLPSPLDFFYTLIFTFFKNYFPVTTVKLENKTKWRSFTFFCICSRFYKKGLINMSDSIQSSSAKYNNICIFFVCEALVSDRQCFHESAVFTAPSSRVWLGVPGVSASVEGSSSRSSAWRHPQLHGATRAKKHKA